jgi:LysR family transcriptional regulator, cyn operon transcriptional activator
MNHDQAKMLDVLSRSHSLSDAAVELGTSQPRLTQQLKSVERELGIDLFLRSPRGLSLSEAGTTFLPYARQIVATFKNAQEALSTLKEVKTNKLRLGASITVSHRLVRDYLLLFHKRYPEIFITVTRTIPRDLVKGLEEGRFDLCFGLELPESALFIREEVFRTDLVGLTVTSLKPLRQTSIEQFCRQPLALAPKTCDTRILLDDALRRARITPKVVLEADDFTTVMAIVRAGAASTIVPRTVVTKSKTLMTSDFRDFVVEVRGTLLYPRNQTTEAKRYVEMVRNLTRASTGVH